MSKKRKEKSCNNCKYQDKNGNCTNRKNKKPKDYGMTKFTWCIHWKEKDIKESGV